MRSRRTILTGLGGIIATTSIAGCSDIDESVDNGDGGGESDSRGAVETVELLLESVISGDIETVNELLHPESTGYPIEDDEQFFPEGEYRLVSVEEITQEEHEEWRNENTGPSTTVEEEREFVQSELGAEEIVHTLVTIEEVQIEEEEDAPFYAIMIDGEWVVYT